MLSAASSITPRSECIPMTVWVISADMVATNNHLHVRFAPNRYRDVAARRTRRKVPEARWTGRTDFETSRFHQVNDPFFK